MILCQVEDCDNVAVWVVPYAGFKGRMHLCHKHHAEGRCICTEGYDNPECPVHEVSSVVKNKGEEND